ncbi:hypothetical protein BDM02DRAFT_3133490 [Thelephora ganbajun]|uniref:Uncharacterized protein n=1 Tax=Thelephora ganbajun TaxID=370292 RepID=A0ACB6YWV0_THEGA|nr:hypothetical protein BDM02DRAFT_3133490 [Thelephora ganbajun]
MQSRAYGAKNKPGSRKLREGRQPWGTRTLRGWTCWILISKSTRLFNPDAIKSHLSKSRGLGSQCADGVLLKTNIESAKHLGSEAKAEAWLEGVVGLYLKKGSRTGDLKYSTEKTNPPALQAHLDPISPEHGDFYVGGPPTGLTILSAHTFTAVDCEITTLYVDILSSADPDLYQFMQCNLNACDAPLYRGVAFPTAPNAEINKKGDIIVTEVCGDIGKVEAYVEEMSSNNALIVPIDVNKVYTGVLKLWNIV